METAGRPRAVAALMVVIVVACGCSAPEAAAAVRHRPAAARVTLEWVGDIALSTQRGLPPGGLRRALAPVAPTLRAADVTTGNLEGTLSTSGPSKCRGIGGGNCFAFQAPPGTAAGLAGLGFDVVNQANNHSMDYGASGRAQTLAALRRARVAETGLPGQITYRRVHGVRIAFLGFAPYDFDSNLLDIAAAQRMVKRARRRASLVVVFIHAGAEGADRTHTPYGSEFFVGENRGSARAFAHAVIRAGAALVLGSGPHVIRGVELYRGRLIAYSLGNFVGYHTLGGGGVLDLSGILRMTLAASGRTVSGRWISVRLVGGLPHLDRAGTAARLVARLSRVDFPASRLRLGHGGTLRLPARQPRGARSSPRS
jgi:Bacterial capsule synthesis protein PGA_cap